MSPLDSTWLTTAACVVAATVVANVAVASTAASTGTAGSACSCWSVAGCSSLYYGSISFYLACYAPVYTIIFYINIQKGFAILIMPLQTTAEMRKFI